MTDIRKKLQTVTLGCSKNKVDTEHILSQVDDLYEIVPEGEDIPVDVLLINTCGFIQSAKEEAIEEINRFFFFILFYLHLINNFNIIMCTFMEIASDNGFFHRRKYTLYCI